MNTESQKQKHVKKPDGKKKLPLYIMIILVVIILAILGGIAWSGWVKPPEVPNPQGDMELPPNTGRANGVYNILVVGVDKVALNTDTIFVVSMDTVNDKVSLMSIPRDTMSNVERKVKKINAAYGVGGKPNITQLKKEIKGLIGLDVDNYVVVNLDAFVEIIDAIGGVTLDVQQNMNYEDPYQNLSIHINKGVQTLNGKDAIGFVRYRKGYVEGDLGRVKAQQQFMEALAKQLIQPSTLGKLPKLAGIVSENMKTDLTVGEMIWFGKQGLEVNIEENMKMFILPGEAEMVQGLSYYLVNETETLAIVNANFNPYDQPITKLNLLDVSKLKTKPSKPSTKPEKVDPEIEAEKKQEKEDVAGEAVVNNQPANEDESPLELEGGTIPPSEGVVDNIPPTDVTDGVPSPEGGGVDIPPLEGNPQPDAPVVAPPSGEGTQASPPETQPEPVPEAPAPVQLEG